MLQFVGLGAADTEHGRGELKDSFAKLHASLSLGSVPDSLPCREEERKRLGGFLGRAMHEGELEHMFPVQNRTVYLIADLHMPAG